MSLDGGDIETWLTPKRNHSRRKNGGGWDAFMYSTREVLLGTKLNILLLSVPLAIGFSGADIDSATFVFSLIGLVPLAERLGFVTEALATYTNDTLGGLLNATFGNATELIICAMSLHNAGNHHDRSYLRIVQLSLLGSIFGNLLLVMGTAFLVGGIAHPRQSFNQEGMGVNSGMLIMAVASILLPSTLSETETAENKGSSELHLSRFESIMMLILYALYLIFQLVTHKHLYEEPHDDPEEGTSAAISRNPSAISKLTSISSRRYSMDEIDQYLGNTPAQLHRMRTMIVHEDEELDDDKGMGLGWALFWLTVITVLIGFLSEMVVDTIKEAHDSLGIPLPFLSTIMLPIVGNAAEHASAILFAYKNKMEITLGVAVGSATQIAVLVIPFTVILAWMMDQPLDLNFEWFEAFTLFLCTMIAIISVHDGTSNWIKGLLLAMTYVFVSGAFFVHSDSDLSGHSEA